MAKQSLLAQIPKTLPFRLRVPCYRLELAGKAMQKLPAAYEIADFNELERGARFGQLRLAWFDEGLAIWAEVKGKKRSVWCRESQILESDGLQIWIDTRDTHNVHRATRFCHWFVLNPAGGGSDKQGALANMLRIHQAREDSPALNRQKIQVASRLGKTGYQLSALLPAACLNGWDPTEHRSIGFYYALVDQELGWQTFSVGPEMPFASDPSLWGTLELAESV